MKYNLAELEKQVEQGFGLSNRQSFAVLELLKNLLEEEK